MNEVRVAVTPPPAPGSTAGALRWSAFAVTGRHMAQLSFSLVLARVLGPVQFGIVSAATVYVTLSMLLLDQGMSSALIQRRAVDVRAPGATATLNALMAGALALVTWVVAPAMATFFHTPALTGLLRVLGIGLLVKSLAITPRAVLSRDLRMRSLGIADVAGAFVGCAAGLTAAALGAGYWSLAVQVVLTDTVVAGVLLHATPDVRFNTDLRLLRPMLPYSLRVFATNGVAYLSRNVDNIAVGHSLGPAALAQYGMAYRVLVIPVQVVGQTVNRVLFPALSRIADHRERMAAMMLSATEVLALLAIPVMSLVACASSALVHLGLGEAWAPTAPILSVLALAGARETIYYITPSLMKATGHARLGLRFELASTTVQVTGILIGLRHGALGVACGYALAGVVLTPVLMAIQRRLTGLSVRSQLAAVLPAVHASAWGAGAYYAGSSLSDTVWLSLVLGVVAWVVACAGVLLLVHRSYTARMLAAVGRLRAGRSPVATGGAT